MLTIVAKEDGTGGDALPLSHLDDRLGGKHGASRTAKGTVGHDVNALRFAEVNDFLLGQRGVVLDLVDGRDDRGMGQKLLKVTLAILNTFTSFTPVHWGSFKLAYMT